MSSTAGDRRSFLAELMFHITPTALVLPYWAASIQAAEAAADAKLQATWKSLTARAAAEITRRHIHGLVRAAHLYSDHHGSLPPAIIANPKLPAGKRLSGLVLLLPFLKADSWIEKDQPCFEPEVVQLAQDVYRSIDQTKAWDDPVNLPAAKTIIPAFLAPQNGPIRDREGYAVSHFTFVQGSEQGFDGAFPGTQGVKISEISDGTVTTLAFGQIVRDMGPWMAEGLSTARQVIVGTPTTPGNFGSQHKSGCYFAMCDSSPFFKPLDADADTVLQQAATRAGGEILDYSALTRLRFPVEIGEAP